MTDADPRRGRPRKQPSDDAKDSKSSVLSLAKGFRVLEAFSGDVEEMTMSEIADVAKLDAGTTFRMLNTLVDLGYVARVGDSRRFRLTLKVLDLGFNAIARKDQRALVRPVLQSLVDEISEAASFGVLEGGDVLYIERVRAGFTRLGVDIRIGTTIPVATSIIGAAILAFLPPEALERTLSIPPRHPLATPKPGRAELGRILADVRKRGYVLQESRISGGLHVLATPVLDAAGHAIGAVSVAAPIIRISAAEIQKHTLPHVLAAAKDIGRALQTSGSATSIP
ncbi:IclR family transcriptional regulator [Xanthobacteraceae bacterium Astr-EGSB]|uniref:IclR family transcriptional regulator n=1 Tax=Astrobacterium formosum TaxID=3069710 RepID=UPI0027B1E660|nr:IclR family transcriptional regulator [Xanthobacteraceae bacterium Astr-EGSB]